MEPASEQQVRASERVPLNALIELRCNEDDELLEADAIDLGAGGVAMRAPFLPPVGVQMQCEFVCPPMGEPVRAAAVVVWSRWEGPQSAAFGMRFLELDTRSATAVRRLVAPAPDPEASTPKPEPPPGIAALHIEGLGAPIEADVRRDQQDRLVLQQALPFLRLGRRVEVEVPGREPRVGRIAAVELQQSADDIPSLTFGVLLDGASEPATMQDLMPSAELEGSVAPPGHSQQQREPRDDTRAPLESPDDAERQLASRGEAERAPRSLDDADPDSDVRAVQAAQPPAGAFADDIGLEADYEDAAVAGASDTWRDPPPFEQAELPDERSRVVAAPKAIRAVAEAAVAGARAPLEATARDRAAHAPGAAPSKRPEPVVFQKPDPAEFEEQGQERPQPGALLLRALSLWWATLRAWLAPRVDKVTEQGKQSVDQFREDVWPGWREHIRSWWSKGRSEAGSRLRAIGHMRKQRQTRRRTTAPAPRASNVQQAAKGTAAAAEGPRFRGRLVLAGVLAFAGVGLSVYALAPRPRSDALQLARPAPVATAAPAPAPAATAPKAAPPAAQPASSAPTPAAAATPADEPQAAEADGDTRLFGMPKVPKGRTYTLRMNNAVESLEGHEVERGFVVRVPGALSLDRASPIAISHSAVARSMILNRGDHSELTIEFVPGQSPAYHVKAAGRSLEITLERP